MTESLLPPNATPLEHAFEKAIARRIEAIDRTTRTLWSPETCPADLLSWLAWALSVDVWDDGWSEERKRQVVGASFAVHRLKGTIGAVRRALDALDIGLDIVEWFENGGAPHTFEITAFADHIFDAGLGIDRALLDLIATQIDHVKPARAHYELKVGERFRTDARVRGGIRDRYRNAGEHAPQPAAHRIDAKTHLRTGFRHCRISRAVHLFEGVA